MASVGLHIDARRHRAAAAFVETRGKAGAIAYAEQIRVLAVEVWRGQRGDKEPVLVRTIQCAGLPGRAPHAVNVTEAVLWALIDLRAYRCAYCSRAGGFA